MAVYFIRVGRKVRIGYSKNPYRRLSSVRCHSTQAVVKLLSFVEGDRKTEKAFHRKFAEYRYRGDFYHHTGKLRGYIATLPKVPQSLPRGPKVRRGGRTKGSLGTRAAKRLGRKGGIAAGRAAAASRMDEAEALVIWRSNPELDNKEVLKLMRGWTEGTAYRHLKRRDTPSGPKPTKE